MEISLIQCGKSSSVKSVKIWSGIESHLGIMTLLIERLFLQDDAQPIRRETYLNMPVSGRWIGRPSPINFRIL